MVEDLWRCDGTLEVLEKFCMKNCLRFLALYLIKGLQNKTQYYVSLRTVVNTWGANNFEMWFC